MEEHNKTFITLLIMGAVIALAKTLAGMNRLLSGCLSVV